MPTSPLPSIVFPSTSKSLPKVSCPTGTEIGIPESTTLTPRVKPSVESIATVRTKLSPKCCATSKTKVSSSDRSTLSAFKISGKWPSSKTTSTTAPII